MIKLSIVTVFKLGKMADLELTVASVRRQNLKPYRHVIVVSGVKNCYANNVQLLKNEDTVLIINQDRSLYQAMNIGLERATGDAVIFLNGGDEFYGDDAIEKINSKYQFGRCLAMRSAQCYGHDIYIRPSLARLADLAKYPSHQAFIAPLPAAKRVMFNEFRAISADYYWMKELADTYGCDISEAVLVRFALGGMSNYPTLKTVKQRFTESGTYRSALESLKVVARLLLGDRLYYSFLLNRKSDKEF